VFTGIVESTGRVEATREVAGGKRLWVRPPFPASECRLGDSLSVSGVCLTVAAYDDHSLGFDVIQETLDRTTLGEKQPGDNVNVERSLRAGDRLDGHFVQGHVDGTADVVRIDRTPREHIVHLRPQAQLLRYIIPKGSVSVDGVSMTIASLNNGEFTIALIPTTVDRTTLGSLRIGDRVNIETDMLVRTIVSRLEHFQKEAGATFPASLGANPA